MNNDDDEEEYDIPVLNLCHPSIVNCMRNIATELNLEYDTNLSEQAWNCLGCILGTNTSVTKLVIDNYDTYSLSNVSWLCDGLQYNQNIKKFKFDGIDLEDAEKMKSLASFLSNNTSLREITLSYCSVGQGGMNILANALMNRTADTLKTFFLDGNNLGDCNLDGLVTALSTCTRLTTLSLRENNIVQRGCTSLAHLLKNSESNLEYLHLSDNAINDEGVGILTDSLSNNTNLRRLSLSDFNKSGNRIRGSGWMSLLKLVCDTSSMTAVVESNHTFGELHAPIISGKAETISALGVDDANLLYVSLKLNKNCRSWTEVVRQKMIWAHAARRGINIADADIPLDVMPVILSWFGDYLNEKNAKLIQYHTPPLSEEVVNTMRLDSLYRIVREMPDLCQSGQPSVDDVSELTDTLAHTSLA